MIDLEVSNYSGSYMALNNLTNLNVTRLDLARALVTVGRSSWGDAFDSGIFRICELLCKALGFTQTNGDNLMLHDRFYDLNQSEKVTISYYFGQAFTKLYSEKILAVSWLLHIEDYLGSIDLHVRGTVPSKTIVGTSTKSPRCPDLIGIVKKDESHIFESKGYSSSYDKAVMQHAINQVSQVKSYNRISPLTRSACFFELGNNPIKGTIIDPEGDENGIDILLNEIEVLEYYYSFFRKNSSFFNGDFKYNDQEYCVTDLIIPGFRFGFDTRILTHNPETILQGILNTGNNAKPTLQKDFINGISLGLDGIILVDHSVSGDCDL